MIHLLLVIALHAHAGLPPAPRYSYACAGSSDMLRRPFLVWYWISIGKCQIVLED